MYVGNVSLTGFFDIVVFFTAVVVVSLEIRKLKVKVSISPVKFAKTSKIMRGL